MNPKMSKIKGSNSNELRQKSGSGKVSSLDETYLLANSINHEYTKLCIHSNNYWLCQQCEIRIRNQLETFEDMERQLTIGEELLFQKYGYSVEGTYTICEHDNLYLSCQQCEIRIRNQDIIDRIDYTLDKYGNDEPVKVTQNSSRNFIVTSDMIPTPLLESAIAEFSSFYYSKNEDGFNTCEGY